MARTKKIILPILLLLGTLADPASATIVVNSTSNGRNVPGVCTLRDAIAAFNGGEPIGGCAAGSPVDLIVLPANATFVLDEIEPASERAALPTIFPGRVLAIDGNGSRIMRNPAYTCPRDGVSSPQKFRLFEVGGGLALRDLTLANGCADVDGNDSGGAILNYGSVTLERVTLENNTARLVGGAISSFSTTGVTIIDSELVGNIATFGGAIHHRNDALEIRSSTLRGNRAIDEPIQGFGAAASAIFSAGELRIENSTLSGNVAQAALGNAGTIELQYSVGTLSASIAFTTIADNVGYGIKRAGVTTPLTLSNTIVSGHSAGDCNGADPVYEDHFGRSIFSDSTCVAGPNDLSGTNPQLDPLASNGGRTRTRLPRVDSPVFDAAPTCRDDRGATIAADQRGVPRPLGSKCDVGAVESEGPLFANGFE